MNVRPNKSGAPVWRASRQGFTLFEIALSLALVATGVISIIMIFPIGLRAVQQSRFQLYAAAKAEEMVEQFSTAHFDNATADAEGPNCWKAASSYRSQTWDLDARISSHRYGMMPLPARPTRWVRAPACSAR